MGQGQDQGLSASLVAARDRLLGKIGQGELESPEPSTPAAAETTAKASASPAQPYTGATSIPGVHRPQARKRPDSRSQRPISQSSGPPIFAERYRVLGKIGEGGAAKVFRAEHTGTGRTVALKLLLNSSLENPNVRARFVEEARVTTKIAHPHIVEMLDAGISSDGLPFVVMELLDGETLAALLKREEKLDWPRARVIILQLAAALAHAHEQGVVHRDVKPDNVIIEGLQLGRPHCKIIDFGLAQLAEQHAQTWVSHVGQPIGTAPTMSPEQVRGQVVTPASDIYALGSVLYRILAGQYPFAAASLVEFATAHLFATPRPLPELDLAPELHAGLQSVISRCLAKEPEDRFPSMAELGHAINALDPASTTLPPLSESGSTIETRDPFSFDSGLPLAATREELHRLSVAPATGSRKRWLAGLGAGIAVTAASAALFWFDEGATSRGVVQAGAVSSTEQHRSRLFEKSRPQPPSDAPTTPQRPAKKTATAQAQSPGSEETVAANAVRTPPAELGPSDEDRSKTPEAQRKPEQLKPPKKQLTGRSQAAGRAGPKRRRKPGKAEQRHERAERPLKTATDSGSTKRSREPATTRRKTPGQDSQRSKSSVLIDPTAKIAPARPKPIRGSKKRLIDPFEQ